MAARMKVMKDSEERKPIPQKVVDWTWEEGVGALEGMVT